MCLCAQVYGYSTRSKFQESRGQFTQQEKTYFGKAFEYYHKALVLLNGQEKSSIWINVSIELSGAYFMMATVLQDYAPLNSMAEEKVCLNAECSSCVCADDVLCQKLNFLCEIATLEDCLSKFYLNLQSLGFKEYLHNTDMI